MNKALLLTNSSSFCQRNLQEFRKILEIHSLKVKEVDNVMAAQEILRKSEENILVFCFCSTESERNITTRVLKKYKYPLVIIMPYNNDPEFPVIMCCATVYTTLSILPLINMVVVP